MALQWKESGMWDLGEEFKLKGNQEDFWEGGHLYYILRNIFCLYILYFIPCTKPFSAENPTLRISRWMIQHKKTNTFRRGKMSYFLNVVHLSTVWSLQHDSHPAQEQEGSFRQWKQYGKRDRTRLHCHLVRLQGGLKVLLNWEEPETELLVVCSWKPWCTFCKGLLLGDDSGHFSFHSTWSL